MSMTAEQEAHLKMVQREFADELEGKYRAGQREHGGNLWAKDGVLDEAIKEVVDLAVYLITLRQQLRGQLPPAL